MKRAFGVKLINSSSVEIQNLLRREELKTRKKNRKYKI